jgi:hypothetical protein
MSLNVLLSAVPTLFTAGIITSATPAAMRPYSIAVAPDPSRTNRLISLSIGETRLGVCCYGVAGPGGATIEGFVQAFLDPVMDRWAKGGPGWKNYLAIVAQVNNMPKWGGETMARYFDPVIHRLIDAIRGIMPGAHDIDLYWSYQFFRER